eukprot:SAG22_NODE_62_length_23371_cov_84.500602_19_plen_69_part_00
MPPLSGQVAGPAFTGSVPCVVASVNITTSPALQTACLTNSVYFSKLRIPSGLPTLLLCVPAPIIPRRQ